MEKSEQGITAPCPLPSEGKGLSIWQHCAQSSCISTDNLEASISCLLKQSPRLGTYNHQNYKVKGMRSIDQRHMLSFLGMLYEIQERNKLQFAFKGRNNSWSWHCPEEPLAKAHSLMSSTTRPTQVCCTPQAPGPFNPLMLSKR